MDRFGVYNHQFEMPSGIIAKRKLIVLRHSDGTLTFTNFGKYVTSGKAYKSPSNDGANQFDFVVQLLNFALRNYRIKKLNDLTYDMVKDFLQQYSSGTIAGGVRPKTRKTVETCSKAILYFLDQYVRDNRGKASIKEKELFRKEIYKDKYNHVKERKVPTFDLICEDTTKITLRDIPNKVFAIFLDYVEHEHPELLGLVTLSAFAGLRPSEACNVRREDSPLGPGIIVNMTDGDVTKIQIDLSRTLILRSDGKTVGYIKRNRIQTVPAIFNEVFMTYYGKYLEYTRKQAYKYEKEYGALNNNRQGRAITYRSYYNAFRRIIKNELIPIFLTSKAPEVVEYGRILLEYNLGPHALRHWYTVQLVLAGYGVPELMNARGDRSPESALTYIQNKGELEKMYTKVANEMFDYFSWAAERTYRV